MMNDKWMNEWMMNEWIINYLENEWINQDK